MGGLADMVEGTRGGLPHEVRGLPSLNLDSMQGAEIPDEDEIDKVLGDTIVCEVIDETKEGEVMRGGIIINQDMTKKMWRKGEVVKLGPNCSGVVKLGDWVMYPNDKGLPLARLGKKYVFLNEERIFCTLKKPKGNK